MKHTVGRTIALISLAAGMSAWSSGQEHPVPSLREQAAIQQQWLRDRLETVLPAVLRRYNIYMWVIPMREYNEDPVFSSLVSATTFAARRRTIYVFFDRGESPGVERIALGGTSQGGLYAAYRDSTLPNAELWGDGQWKLLARLIRERDPKRIAVNISLTHAFSDGLSAGEWEQLQASIGEPYRSRIVREERLALDLIAVRVPAMVEVYQKVMMASHAIIRRAFSSEVITPGQTTTQDVVWWMRQTAQECGFGTWFQPSVDVQRAGGVIDGQTDPVIERGDVLHCDFGLTTMGLNTDTQHMGYVLREGENEVPPGLVKALEAGNQLQDIVVSELRVGTTGNEILSQSLEAMRKAGIEGTVYSHPVGEHGHGAGPLIGLWDRQEGVPGRGDVEVLPDTWFSIELQATSEVNEWKGQKVRMALEEDVMIDGSGKVKWVLSRQSKFHVVK